MNIAVKYLNIGDYFKYGRVIWRIVAKEPFTIYLGLNRNIITNNINPNTIVKIKLPRKYKKHIKKIINN